MGKSKEKAKQPGKSKKLERVAAELGSIRADLKKVLEQQATLAKLVGKLAGEKPAKSRPTSKSKAKPARSKAPSKPAKPARSQNAPARPVLVQNEEAVHMPATRSGG